MSTDRGHAIRWGIGLLAAIVLPACPLAVMANDGPASAASAPPGVSQPVWEAGVGLSLLSLPDYRGSDRRRNWVLPIPYFVYRAERVSLDRGGLKAELLERGALELDFSVNLSQPARSDGNSARHGMADLRPTLELGPQLIATLWRAPQHGVRLQAQLPVRYAFVLGRGMRDAGFIAHPRVNLDARSPFGLRGWHLGLVSGPMFATARQHDYYYGVDPSEATAVRPAWRARGGYSGWQTTLAMSRRFPNHWIGGFLRIDQLAGAAFADSPLVRRRSSVAAGVAVSWVFAESAERITLRR